MSRVDATRPRTTHHPASHDDSPGAHLVRAMNGVVSHLAVRAAQPDHREPAKRAARPDRREPDLRELAAALVSALHGHPHHATPRQVVVRGVPIHPHGGGVDLSFATEPAKRFAVNAGQHVFGPLIGAAVAKNNEHVYGRPTESFGGTLLSRTTGTSPADRALAAEGTRTLAQLLSYSTPPVTGSGVSDAKVFVPYVGRRVYREAMRQLEDRKMQRLAAQRAAAGLPPFDPNVPPQSWDQLVEYLKNTN